MTGWFRRRRRAQLRATPLPAAWATLLADKLPRFASMSHEPREALADDASVFLAEKRFVGCAGLLEHVADVLRAYGATNPAECFAVATEVFFEHGPALRAKRPALYAHLAEFYGQDPGGLEADGRDAPA